VSGPGVGVKVGSGVKVGGGAVNVGAARGFWNPSQADRNSKLQRKVSKTRTFEKAPLVTSFFVESFLTSSINYTKTIWSQKPGFFSLF
jgi:hypothetical protein